jgi:type II secretory pathway predicted ATPase ExeA
MQAEHKPRHAEGPFFANLLDAVGCPDPDKGTNPTKRIRLINKIREACTKNGSGTAIMFVDEAQRLAENEYEWLRDVQDHLDRMQIKLFMFLVGQQELYSIKVNMQRAGRTQIVAKQVTE